jgi:2-polyprenyl-3-methyl-5-hydroxy-6-metoxy-1,4-benzoquinol methylase
MNKSCWGKNNLRKLIINQELEYQLLGFESQNQVESERDLFQTWLPHRQKTISLIPEECHYPNKKAIDIGGGTGKLCCILASLGLSCTNVDHLYLNDTQLNNAGKSFIPQLIAFFKGKNITVEAIDINGDKFSSEDNFYDLAICSEVIEHLPNSPKPMLSEIYRILKPEGYFILTTPNQASIGRRIRSLLGYSIHDNIKGYYNMELYPIGTPFRGHVREYTLDELKYMLTRENFSIINIVNFSLTPDIDMIIRKWKIYANISKIIAYKFIDKIMPMLSNYFFISAQK